MAGPTRAQVFLVGALALASLVMAAGLHFVGGFSSWLVLGLPLTVSGLALVFMNTTAALSFIAFSIMPFGVLQAEIVGATINLPEFLILSLTAREVCRALAQRSLFPDDFPVKSTLIFGGCMVIGIATGLYRGNGTINVLQDFRQFSEFLVLFWVIVRCVRSPAQVFTISVAFVLGGTLIGVHGVIQHFVPVGISETQIASDLVLHRGVRSSSFYGATPLGGLMVLVVCPAIGLLVGTKRRGLQGILLLCIALCLLAILYTKTRGSWLGLAVALAFLFYSARPNRRILAAFGVVVLLCLIAAGPAILARLSTLAAPADDRSLMERTQYYATAAHIGRAHPVLGLGWGCYYDIEDILQAERYVQTARPEHGVDVEEATVHSAYLQIFVKSGLVGVAGFMIFMAAWLERIWRAFRNRGKVVRKDHRAVLAGLTAGLFGYLCHSSFENFFQWPVMAQSFWLLAGLSYVGAVSIGGTRTYPRAATLTVCTGATLFTLFVIVSLILETRHSDHFRENVAAALAEGNVEKALEIARRAKKMRLNDPYVHSVYAEALIENGDLDEALEQLSRAEGASDLFGGPLWRSTDHEFYFAPAHLLRGRLHVESGDYIAALSEFERARAYTDLEETEFERYHGMLYEVYAGFGFWSRALKFGSPNLPTIQRLDPASLHVLGRASLHASRWDVLVPAARRLCRINRLKPTGHLLFGRMFLALEQWPEARGHLELAALEGAPSAWYYLGQALAAAGARAEAANAFLQTDPENFYYPVSMAEAAYSLSGLADAEDRQAAVATLLQDELSGMARLPRSGDGNGGPRAFSREVSMAGPGEPQALILHWGADNPDPPDVTARQASPETTIYELGPDGEFLQLIWTENLLVHPGAFPSNPGAGPVPGWIEGGRDWFDLRTEYRAWIGRDANGRSEIHIPGVSWFYSVPARPERGRDLLLLAGLQAPKSAAHLYWHEIDLNTYLPVTHTVMESSSDTEFVEIAAYRRLEPPMDAIQLQCAVFSNTTARLRGPGLFPVQHPDNHMDATGEQK